MLNKTNNPHYDFPIEMVRLNAIGQTQDNGLPHYTKYLQTWLELWFELILEMY